MTSPDQAVAFGALASSRQAAPHLGRLTTETDGNMLVETANYVNQRFVELDALLGPTEAVSPIIKTRFPATTAESRERPGMGTERCRSTIRTRAPGNISTMRRASAFRSTFRHNRIVWGLNALAVSISIAIRTSFVKSHCMSQHQKTVEESRRRT